MENQTISIEIFNQTNSGETQLVESTPEEIQDNVFLGKYVYQK